MRRFIIYTVCFLLTVMVAYVAVVWIFPYNPNGFILAQGDKMAMLCAENRQPSVVLLGGSTVAFGYNSEIIEERLGIPVLNCGLHASFGMKFILDEAESLLKKGDVLVFVPEIDQFYDRLPYGELELTDWLVVSRFKNAKTLCCKQWWSVANNLPAHLRRRVDYWLYKKVGLLKEDVYRRDGFNAHGDMVAHWEDTATVYHFEQQRTHVEEWNEDFFNYYLGVMARLEKRGVRVVIVPTPLAKSEFEACREPFMYAIERINASRFPYALPFEQYVMPDSMFYDTPYHLQHAGADTLSLRLTEILMKQ